VPTPNQSLAVREVAPVAVRINSNAGTRLRILLLLSQNGGGRPPWRYLVGVILILIDASVPHRDYALSILSRRAAPLQLRPKFR
jgi:hypothetical protein